LANNLELRVLNEEIQITKNEVIARQGAYLPFVTIGGGGGLDGVDDDPEERAHVGLDKLAAFLRERRRE
jgi:hypothetical protein